MSTEIMLNTDLTSLIIDITKLLPELSSYIERFHQTIVETGVNVSSDASDNLFLDAPSNISPSDLDKIGKKVSIIDRLINSHDCTLNDLFKRGSSIEESLKEINPRYKSQLIEHIDKFKEIRKTYIH